MHKKPTFMHKKHFVDHATPSGGQFKLWCLASSLHRARRFFTLQCPPSCLHLLTWKLRLAQAAMPSTDMSPRTMACSLSWMIQLLAVIKYRTPKTRNSICLYRNVLMATSLPFPFTHPLTCGSRRCGPHTSTAPTRVLTL